MGKSKSVPSRKWKVWDEAKDATLLSEQARLGNKWVEIMSALQGRSADTCSKRFGRLMAKSAETQAAAGREDVSQRSASELTVASGPVASNQPGVVVLDSALDDSRAFFFAMGELTTCAKCPQRLKAPARCNVLTCPKCRVFGQSAVVICVEAQPVDSIIDYDLPDTWLVKHLY